MTTRYICNLFVRLKRKRDHDKLAAGAQSVRDVIPRATLKLTNDSAIYSQSVRAAKGEK